MKASLHLPNKTYTIDLNAPIDISIAITPNAKGVSAWYVGAPRITPAQTPTGEIAVAKGASTNFNKVVFYPHAHGTHTECLGHITSDFYSVNQVFSRYFFLAQVISITPERQGQDLVITKAILEMALQNKTPEALVVRTLPNADTKKTTDYAHTNPAYFSSKAMQYIKEIGVLHLLVDLPSVDKEKDQGALASHKVFWDINTDTPRYKATITEFIYVPDTVLDGSYILNLQLAAIENNASPSRPVLYEIAATL